MTADDQQERLDPRWIAGFVDGEGCFHVSINQHPRMPVKWQVLPEFRIVQLRRDGALLRRIQRFFQAWKVVVNRGDRKELRIRKLNELRQVVQTLNQYQLMSKKRKDFELFSKIIDRMKRRERLTSEGLTKIANLSWQMNRKVKPRYLESSETLRRKSPAGD